MAHIIETLRKYWKPIVIVGALGIIAYLARRGATQESQPSLTSSDISGQVAAEPLGLTDQDVVGNTPRDSCGGAFYPVYGFCYPYAPVPLGENWDACVNLPPGTTVWGAISAINGDPTTPADSTRASVSIYDRSTGDLINRYDFNPQLPSNEWPSQVSRVPANGSRYTIVCAADN